MSNPNQPDRAGELNAPLALGEALRALPQLGPDESAWPRMLERLQREPDRIAAVPRRRALRRYVWPAAVAAMLVIAFSATLAVRRHSVSAPVAGESTQRAATESAAGASSVHNAAISTKSHDASSTNDLAALQAHSRALEQWLRDTGAASVPQSAQDLAASTEIEDMIGLVDVQLGAADAGDTNAMRSLWQRRVALLEDLSTLRYSTNALSLRRGLAANDAWANAMNAAPAVWRN